MPRSSRHKSHKQSKHSAKDYSDSEEDVIKMKEKSSKDENTGRVHRDSASGEKRKISSQVREGKDSKDLGGHGNGEVLEYVSSKRRKEKSDVVVGGDRWSGGGDERGDSDRNVEKEMHKGESLKVDSKLQEISNRGKTRIESKNKSKRHGSGSAGERKEDSLASVVMDKEESKSKGEPKRKSDRDSSAWKEGKELKEKDKDRRSDKEKNGVQESKSGDAEVKLVDMDIGKKQGFPSGDFSEERKGKHARENSERTAQDDLRNPELEKEIEKRVRRRKEGSSEIDKHHDDSKERDEKRLSARGDRSKDVKHRDDKHKDGSYADKYQEDGHKDDRRRDEKYRKEADKDSKLEGDKYREDGEKEARSRDDKHREDGDRDNKRKDEKHREDGERDSRRKDDKYRETIERDGRRDDKYHEDGDREGRHKDDRYHEDGDKDLRRGDERCYEDGDRDDRRKDNSYRDDGNRDNRKEEKYREDFDRDKRLRDIKCRDGHTSRDRSGENADLKRSRDDGYAGDHQSRKSSAYDDSPPRDDRTAKYRDDQGRRRNNEKEDYGDIRSRSTRDRKSDAEKKSASSARIDLVAERVRSTSRNADIELSSSHGRKRSSPTPSSHAPRDHYRALKQDESKYKDYNYEERVRHNINSSRDYTGAVGESDKTTSSRSLEKIGVKDDGHLGELSAERRLKSDIRSSPLQLVDKSPSSSTDRRQLSRRDVRRSNDVEESTQRSGGSRDVKEYSGKEGRGTRELGMDIPPGDERLQPDTDTLSVSSPFMRNSHFSSNSKPFRPPPPFRTGVESPPNIRNRRINDHNMGRIQGNMWRGVPSWPSPVGNGFLPFPHAPPPVGFHSVMQPFPPPPMFGVRPSMELNHPSPYPGRPMGWRNQVDDSYPPLHSWDASNSVFGDYGRSDWDHSRNTPSGRGWETGGELSKGPNRTASLEMSSSEKENKSARSADEAFPDQSVQPAQNEQTPADQQAERSDISQLTKNSGKNDFEAPFISFGETSHVAKMSKMDDVRHDHFYLSKLDISADLTEPELYDKCTGLINVDPSDVDDAKILFVEEAVEAKMSPHKLRSYTVFASTDDSVFQKSMFLYKRLKENFWAEDGERSKVMSEFIPIADQNVEDDKTKKVASQGVEDALPNFDIEENPQNDLQIDLPVANIMEKSEEPVSSSNHVDMGVNSVFDLGLQENDVEEKPLSALPSEVEDVHVEDDASKTEEQKLVDTKYGNLLNTDVSSEAMMPESILVSESVNLSRIHHSPESTR